MLNFFCASLWMNSVEIKWTLTALHMKAFLEQSLPNPAPQTKTTTAGIIRESYFENIGLRDNEGRTQNRKKTTDKKNSMS